MFSIFSFCTLHLHFLSKMLAINRFSRLFNCTFKYNELTVRYYTPRRAMMYVPGDDEKKLIKAFGLDVDCITMDCEDGVALNRKVEARNTIREMLNNGKPIKQRSLDLAVRVNSLSSGFCREDLESILSAKNLPDTIFLPKVEEPDNLQWFSDEVNILLDSNKPINLGIFIESARAMVNLTNIVQKAIDVSQIGKIQPVALVFGSDDFCASIGATRSESSTEIIYARQKLVTIAKAFHLQAIDMVYIQYKDSDGLRKQCEEGARMGYTGKQVIHPAQVSVVQETFLPSKEKVEWATSILREFEEKQKFGKGAFTFKGSMIDMPTVKQAQNIIELIKSTQPTSL